MLTAGLLKGIDDIMSACIGLPQSFTYYSHLAALCHVWRDNYAAIFTEWKTKYPDTLESSGVYRICPRPISGRWGRKTHCENHILTADPITLEECMTTVLKTKNYFAAMLKKELEEATRAAEEEEVHDDNAEDNELPVGPRGGRGGRGRGRGRPRGRGARGARGGAHAEGRGRGKKRMFADAVAQDEDASRQENLGKWAKMALIAMRNHRFWILASISNRISEKLDILMWKIEKRGDPGTVGNLARLVDGGALEVKLEIDTLLDADTWERWAFLFPEGDERNKFITGVTRLVLRIVADYDMRIMHRIDNTPASLLILACDPPADKCQKRVHFASKLLGADPLQIHATMRNNC